MKIFCICRFCLKSSNDEGALEINFNTGKLYYVCPHCRKENETTLEPMPPALPRIKIRKN